jgi:hypothetical protein
MSQAKRSTGSGLLIGLLPFAGIVALAALFCAGVVCLGGPCWRTGLRYGIWAAQCPATELRLTAELSADGLVRGTDVGWVDLTPTARWLTSDDRWAGEGQGQLDRGFDWTLTLVDASGAEVPGLEIVERARRPFGGVRARVRLPDVPDGDYLLRATVRAPFGETTVEAPLPLFAPALVHVMTDRPLYKPGQTVLFRSAVLRRTDEAPIEGRPGRWVVTDPQGVEVLSERGSAGPWGVASSSFPLDEDAPQGRWRVAWQSGEDLDQAWFDVRPFRLPRFSVELRPARGWFAVGDELVFEGVAKYASGAPIAGAPVTLRLQVAEGRWPLPMAWESPRAATTGPDGTFRVAYGPVPPDLMDLDRLSAVADVVEPAGEQVAGAATAVLSPEPVRVVALTELGDGLVEGFNNRVYLRVTTPDGTPLPEADLRVVRPYDPTDEGKSARTDVDGVAVVQLDPGPPVTVVTPAPPLRVRPVEARPASVTRADDLVGGAFDLPTSRALDTAMAGVTDCGERATGAHSVEVAVRLSPGGQVTTAAPSGDDAVSRCVAERLRAVRFPLGRTRTFALAFQIPEAPVPSLHLDAVGGTTVAFDPLARAVAEARPCVRRDGRDTELFEVHYGVRAGSRDVSVTLEPLDAPGVSDACIRAAVSGIRLPREVDGDLLGVGRIRVEAPHTRTVSTPQPTTSVAYELSVSASLGDEALGSGRVVLPVGAVPPMRLRATPPLAHPGDQVVIELVRGPTWSGSLPEELVLWEGTVEVARSKVVDKAATFALPADADGFLHAEWAGARAVVFVSPADPLSLSVAAEQQTYAPGDRGSLRISTKRGDAPVQAGVGLVGVDAMLGQLAPLLPPDDYGRITVRATADQPAFGAFDPKALALGRIRGENAARAAVLRVTKLPMDPAGDRGASARGASTFDPRAVLIENFYGVLVRAAADLAAWEASAPASEALDAARMVAIWDGALDALEAEGKPVVDGYGRRLSLAVVPVDLLAQVDPRKLVSDATRMPEDAEDFVQYVQREVR